ncbi:UNVERIFIED_CONTAM: hypothetical protein FKN15_034528 [Acipenser sinensis]
MEETRSLKLDKKKPISSNLSKGIMTILENPREVRSIDTPDLPHVKKGVYKNTSVGDHKILISALMVGSEDCDTVDIDLLLEELRDIPVTPEKKGKSKVSGRDKDPEKGENTQLKESVASKNKKSRAIKQNLVTRGKMASTYKEFILTKQPSEYSYYT